MASLRDSIQNEILSNTNKPRFCYMGYAPPLCIGDDFDKPSSNPNKVHPVPIRVSYPKRGTGPDACFSPSSALCIGDVYVDKWKSDARRRGRSLSVFKPSGKSPDVQIIPYIPNPIRDPTRTGTSGKCFIVPSHGGLFTPKVEYMSSLENNSKKGTNINHPGPPFKSSGKGTRLFEEYSPEKPVLEPIAAFPLDKMGSQKLQSNSTPFKPPGKAVLHSPFPGYNSPSTVDLKSRSHATPNTAAAWRCVSVPLLSSPTTSIAMNPTNLFRA
jgi:hypothetical protein